VGAVQVIGVDQSPISNRLRPYIAGLDREAMIESTGHFALGANRKADGQEVRIPVFFQERNPKGYERLPQSQDDGSAQVLGDTAGRVPCLPAFQRGR